MPPDSQTGEELRRPFPDPTPLGAPALPSSLGRVKAPPNIKA